MTVRDQLSAMRDLIGRTAAACGAYEVWLFGSVARGEERADSDIDFLVTLEAGRTLLDLARLEESLEMILGRRVDVVTLEALQEPIRSAALREAVRV
jgi:predicted nucleotidyltransferase